MSSRDSGDAKNVAYINVLRITQGHRTHKPTQMPTAYPRCLGYCFAMKNKNITQTLK